MSPGNDRYTTVTQNAEPFKSKRNNNEEKKSSTSEKKKKKFISGDSLVKHVEGSKLSKDVDTKHKVYVRRFRSAKVKCMKYYVKPCVRENSPDHVIINVGTNKLDSERKAEIRSKSIIDEAKNVSTNTSAVSISWIVHTERQVLDVNDELSKMYREAELDFITHKNINLRADLNNSRLHINRN